MVRICIRHNAMATEDGVWLKKLEDVTEIVRRNHYICSIERCSHCVHEDQRKWEFLRGDNGQKAKETTPQAEEKSSQAERSGS